MSLVERIEREIRRKCEELGLRCVRRDDHPIPVAYNAREKEVHYNPRSLAEVIDECALLGVRISPEEMVEDAIPHELFHLFVIEEVGRSCPELRHTVGDHFCQEVVVERRLMESIPRLRRVRDKIHECLRRNMELTISLSPDVFERMIRVTLSDPSVQTKTTALSNLVSLREEYLRILPEDLRRLAEEVRRVADETARTGDVCACARRINELLRREGYA